MLQSRSGKWTIVKLSDTGAEGARAVLVAVMVSM